MTFTQTQMTYTQWKGLFMFCLSLLPNIFGNKHSGPIFLLLLLHFLPLLHLLPLLFLWS